MTNERASKVTFRDLLEGLQLATGRFMAARASSDPAVVFRPLFEALNWAVVLDDHVAARWAPDGRTTGLDWRSMVADSGMVSGVRLARNRVHHQWADALELHHGMTLPITLPLVLFEWRWRAFADLPSSDKPERYGTAEYIEHLEGRPARLTLYDLRQLYQGIADLIEPVLPGSEIVKRPQ